MLTRVRTASRSDESGFTLIELLVVIIIIGILAAVAIPIFLNQRKKAYDTAAKSDLKEAAVAQETVLADTGGYTMSAAPLISAGYKSTDRVILTIVSVRNTSDSFCLRASHMSNPGTVWYIDSGANTAPSKIACS